MLMFKVLSYIELTLNKYFSECQCEWVEVLESLRIIDTPDGFKSIKKDTEFVVFDSSIFRSLEESEDDWKIVYDYASKNTLILHKGIEASKGFIGRSYR